MEECIFQDLKISDYHFLSALDSRRKCKKCGKSRMYYCYTCFLALPDLEALMPTVELPFKVDIIKHPGEVCGKSTAIHAAILAPSYVNIHIYPNIPDYNPNETILIFPDKGAKSLKELFYSKLENLPPKEENSDTKLNNFDYAYKNFNDLIDIEANINSQKSNKESNSISCKYFNNFNSLDNPINCHTIHNGEEINFNGKMKPDEINLIKNISKVKIVIFIDCTWLQTFRIVTDSKLSGMPRIKLDEYETRFWRYQRDKPPTYLSTIEAIYYFVREYSEVFDESTYKGQFDNLLFFFCFFYEKIMSEAVNNGKILKSYLQRCEHKGKILENMKITKEQFNII